MKNPEKFIDCEKDGNYSKTRTLINRPICKFLSHSKSLYSQCTVTLQVVIRAALLALSCLDLYQLIWASTKWLPGTVWYRYINPKVQWFYWFMFQIQNYLIKKALCQNVTSRSHFRYVTLHCMLQFQWAENLPTHGVLSTYRLSTYMTLYCIIIYEFTMSRFEFLWFWVFEK